MLEQTLWEHLMELKNTLIKLGLTWVGGTLLTVWWREEILNFITGPLAGEELFLFTVTGGFTFLLKIHLLLGFLVAFPLLLWFVWQYLLDVFGARGRQYVQTLIPTSLILAYVGVLYGYLFLIPSSVDLLLNIQPAGTEYLISADEYVSFVLGLLVIMVLIFQIPLVVFSAVKSKLVKAEFFSTHRKEVYFGFVVATAIFTPTPDVFTLFLIVLPMLVMYEIALLLGRL